jgi:hypothetical protein
MTKHTPGPWQVYHWDTHSDAFDGSDEHESPYVLETSKDVNLLDEHDANARLMEAAPELFEALIGVMQNINNPKGWDPIHPTCRAAVKDAEAAIAKARGE